MASQNGSTYEAIMGKKETSEEDERAASVEALTSRLVAFRTWLSEEANVQVHPAICIVNGEATDGTKNAPVLVFERPPGSQQSGPGSTGGPNAGRVGLIDWEGDRTLYDRTMGCQIRAVREIKKDEVMMTVPRAAMITPDLVASSDAGRAVLACCRPPADGKTGFWDSFENTTICESKFMSKVARNSGPQLLVKILQERKKAETCLSKRIEEQHKSMVDGKPQLKYTLLEGGKLSTRAPLLAFLIHQRFSDTSDPPVESLSTASVDQFRLVKENDDANALRVAQPIHRIDGTPQSFGAYCRTLPSTISLPLCWKRSELALLAASIPGLSLLQEVAARTQQLASEFVALLESGILERFPETFPAGLLTWDRWVWAAAVVSSRALPVEAYIDAGQKDAAQFSPENKLEMQSPVDVWNELGVMIPLLDMLNHEVEENQVTWESCVPSSASEDESLAHPPRAILHKKVRKGCEIYTCYGHYSNGNLLLQYGFAQLGNQSDEVKVGWGLSDSVGHLDPPEDFVSPIPNDDNFRKFLVFETTDDSEVSKWWTEERLNLLEKEAFPMKEDGFMESLKTGKKLTSTATCDGVYNPILLTVLVVATMPKIELQKFVNSKKETVTLSRRHQYVFRSYLAFFLSRKLEKLLQNVSNGLKDLLGTGKLWASASKGGLSYKPEEENSEDEFIGWQSYFESHVYKTTMEVERNYYAMGADSCVLTLYDGQLRALQESLNGVCSDEKFNGDILNQLRDLGFNIATEEDEQSNQANGGTPSKEKKSPRSRRRSKQKQATTVSNNVTDRPPALKLHVGNLSFTTTPSEMYDYFSSLYGKDNILECHIPIERDSGRSRGFGFVTMPDELANRVLDSGKKHEIGGRLVKLAKSNSGGTSTAGKSQGGSNSMSSDRCASCGYRPKYCTCARPSLPGADVPDPRRDDRDYSYYGSGDRYKDPPPPDYHDERDRYGRPYDRYGRSDYEDRYYDRDRPRDYDRDRRARSRSPPSRSSSRRWEDDRRRDDDRERKRSRSSSRDRERRRKKKRRSRSRSPVSPPYDD